MGTEECKASAIDLLIVFTELSKFESGPSIGAVSS